MISENEIQALLDAGLTYQEMADDADKLAVLVQRYIDNSDLPPIHPSK
jgi:hypothetical protein